MKKMFVGMLKFNTQDLTWGLRIFDMFCCRRESGVWEMAGETIWVCCWNFLLNGRSF
jgi:hypothetical protein